MSYLLCIYLIIYYPPIFLTLSSSSSDIKASYLLIYKILSVLISYFWHHFPVMTLRLFVFYYGLTFPFSSIFVNILLLWSKSQFSWVYHEPIALFVCMLLNAVCTQMHEQAVIQEMRRKPEDRHMERHRSEMCYIVDVFAWCNGMSGLWIQINHGMGT